MFVGWSLPHTRGYHVALKTQKTPPVQVHTLQNLILPFSHTRVVLIALKGITLPGRAPFSVAVCMLHRNTGFPLLLAGVLFIFGGATALLESRAVQLQVIQVN